MRVNFRELVTRAENIVEEDYPKATWEGIVESVLRDLNPNAKILQRTSVPVELEDGTATIDIPDGIYEILAVSFQPTGKRSMMLRRLSAYDTASVGWHQDMFTITVQNLKQDEGNVDIDHYANLTMTEEGTEQVFNLPEKYHEVLLKGVLAMTMQKEEELDRKQDFYQEYMMAKQVMMAERVKEVEPWNMQNMGQGGK